MWIVVYNDEHGNVIEERFNSSYEAGQFVLTAMNIYNNIHTFKEPFNRED